jgi:hypothetical protein
MRALRWLLLVNVAATVTHYLDNIVFFAQYPEPPWMMPHLIDAFWFVMTPFALFGYKLIARGFMHVGGVVLYVYATMSLLVLAHYKYAPLSSIRFRIHLFIIVEATLALALAAYVAALQIRHHRLQKERDVNCQTVL